MPFDLTRAERAAFRHWQGCTDVHPMTCGNDSSHPPLYLDWLRGPIACYECDYRQDHIPDEVMDFFLDEAVLAVADRVCGWLWCEKHEMLVTTPDPGGDPYCWMGYWQGEVDDCDVRPVQVLVQFERSNDG